MHAMLDCTARANNPKLEFYSIDMPVQMNGNFRMTNSFLFYEYYSEISKNTTGLIQFLSFLLEILVFLVILDVFGIGTTCIRVIARIIAEIVEFRKILVLLLQQPMHQN